MSSGTGAPSAAYGGGGRNKDTYEPEQQGMRNIASRDGYAQYNGAQPPPYGNGTPQSAYLYGRRPSSTGPYDARKSGNAYGYGKGDYDREYSSQRRNSSAPRGRSYVPNNYDDSEDSDSEDDRRNSRALEKRGRRSEDKGDSGRGGRSRSRIRQRITDIFTGDEKEMGAGNSESKKWAATVAGAVAGGFAARTAKKDNWMPAAIGAFIGGFAAREAEKAYFLHKDSKDKEEMAYEGKHSSR